MVKIVEVVQELHAEGFAKNDRITAGRVVKDIDTGLFACQVEATVRGVAQPNGPYATAEEARGALIDFWAKCDQALPNVLGWTPLQFV